MIGWLIMQEDASLLPHGMPISTLQKMIEIDPPEGAVGISTKPICPINRVQKAFAGVGARAESVP